MPKALVSAGYLNGLRTAAANAVAVSRLARPESSVLGVIGAGHQAEFEVRAVADQRHLEEIKIWSRSNASANALCDRLSDLPARVHRTDRERAVVGSDLVTTVTPAQEPLVAAAWVAAGTHISAMGADTQGKQELDRQVARDASCFADYPQQAVRIGELQHAFGGDQHRDVSAITAIGDVLLGRHPGRRTTAEVTVFDSSGIAIQDLYVADAVLQHALQQGAAVEQDF